eukprot:gene10200-21262_t
MIKTLPPITYTKRPRSKKAEKDWYCHCCIAANSSSNIKCSVCGRDKNYAINYHLPLHGVGAASVRKSQMNTLFTDMESVHDTDSMHWTSLHSCSLAGNNEVVEELLARGSVVNALGEHDYTPLHLAAHSGSLDTVISLLCNGANVNAFTAIERNCPLHLAAQEGWREVVEALLAEGAVVDCKNILERTPFHLAALLGRPDIGVVLLKGGACASLRDIHGWDATQIATFHQHDRFLQLLDEVEREEREYREQYGGSGSGSTSDPRLSSVMGSVLWTDVVRTKAQRKKEIQRETIRWQTAVRESNVARSRILILNKDFMTGYSNSKPSATDIPAFVPPVLAIDAAPRMQFTGEQMYNNNTGSQTQSQTQTQVSHGSQGVQVVRLGGDRVQRAPMLNAIERSDTVVLGMGCVDSAMSRRIKQPKGRMV